MSLSTSPSDAMKDNQAGSNLEAKLLECEKGCALRVRKMTPFGVSDTRFQ